MRRPYRVGDDIADNMSGQGLLSRSSTELIAQSDLNAARGLSGHCTDIPKWPKPHKELLFSLQGLAHRNHSERPLYSHYDGQNKVKLERIWSPHTVGRKGEWGSHFTRLFGNSSQSETQSYHVTQQFYSQVVYRRNENSHKLVR